MSGVSAQFLLEGAVYALEQAGRLLHDAHLLYKNERYASSRGKRGLAETFQARQSARRGRKGELSLVALVP